MDLNTYQKAAKTTAKYPSPEYPFICLVEEQDEAKTAWIRLDLTSNEEHKELFHKELGDLSWEVAMAMEELGLKMATLKMYLNDAYHDELEAIDIAIGTIASVIAKAMRKRGLNSGNTIHCLNQHWVHHDLETKEFYTERREIIVQQLGRILNAIKYMAESTGSSLEQILQMNIDKLQGRKERGTICGSGDNR